MTLHCLKWLALLVIFFTAGAAQAQPETYPSRPVRVISDSAPGSAIDVTLRIVADRLGQAWGQQVLAVNQPGGGGAISARAAAEAVPDGYTLFQPALSLFLAMPGRAPNLPLELPRDFMPIGSISAQPMFIAVTPALGVKSLPELIALAKQRPGEISYAATGVGRITHLTGELLQLRTGIKMLLVPYSGGPSHALNDILGGRVTVIIEAYPGLAGAVQAGAIKPIAVAASQRLPDFPDLPTVAETLPDFIAMGWQGLVAPNGTPETIVRKVSKDLRDVLDQPAVKQQVAARGGYVRPMSPDEVTSFIRDQQQTWNPILQKLALQPPTK
jgi:tripartite-type tricarboxylate transporter receptor subunit TctC